MSGIERVRLDDGQVEYAEIPGTEPALLLAHEGLGSVGLWRDFPARVAEATGRRVVAYSRFGHGYSDPPPAPRGLDFMRDEAARVLPELLDTLGIERPLLIGHSDGGSIALLHAAAHPVTGVVAMAPHTFTEELGLRGIEQARAAYLDGDLAARMARHHADADVTFWQWNDVWLDPGFRRWNIVDDLRGIGCPLLLVQGDADPYGSFAHVEDVARVAAGPVRRLDLSCGHAPHLECPEQTLQAVTEFVRNNPG